MWRNPTFSTMQKRKLEAAKVFGLVVLLPILTILFVSQVFGQELLKKGELYKAAAVMCDRAEQAISIVEAHVKNGHDAAEVVYRTLYETPNEEGDPTCAFGTQWPITPVRQLREWYGLKFPDNKTHDVFLIEVNVFGGMYYILSFMPMDRGA